MCHIFHHGYKWSNEIGFGALASFGIFLATTIPEKTGIFFTDRKRYQRLISHGTERDVELAILRIISIYGKDNSYLNIIPEDLQLTISDKDYKYFGLFTKLCYEYEQYGDFMEETENEFNNMSKEVPKTMVKQMNNELVKFKSNLAKKTKG